MRGLTALREMELKEKRQVIFTTSNRVSCSSADCPFWHFWGLLDPEIIGAPQRTFYRITGSAVGGTRISQVLSASELAGCVGSVLFERMKARELNSAHWTRTPGL